MDAGIRSEDIPLHLLVEKASGDNPSYFNPSSAFVCEQKIERYPWKHQRN